MTEHQADLLKSKLIERLKGKFSDITISFDIFRENNLLVIHLFWDRINENHWNRSKRFNCKIDNYLEFLESDIIPFMEEQNA